jgi:monooxygenase
MAAEHLDVLIVGAGLSGIGAGYHLQERCPEKTYAILEARGDLGGTWDLFRYPGVRSDSDMHTLGYRFRPWTGAKAIAEGDSILRYLRQTAGEHGITKKIRFHHRVLRAEWSTSESRWTVEAERSDTGEIVRLSCAFLWVCSGYYRYDEGYAPDFEGAERFAGQIVHPQHWTDGVQYSGKRVVVIGSGATAVTLVPSLARHAAHVTMLQRSPSYVVSLPAEDPLARALRRGLSDRAIYSAIRWKNILLQIFSYQLSRRRPELMKAVIRRGVKRALPVGYEVDKHFKPTYNPWDQRLCLAPDGDLFEAISVGSASVVTDQVETFTGSGIKLKSGAELEADLIVTATGLNLVFLGDMQLVVDERDIDPSKAMTYKGMMLSGIPNFAFTLGYTNASWTLKADLTAEYVCRLLNHMQVHRYGRCAPEVTDPSITEQPLLDFSAGYVLRSIDQFPNQGSRSPWRMRMNYPLDARAIRFGAIDDGTLRFSPVAAHAQRVERLAS